MGRAAKAFGGSGASCFGDPSRFLESLRDAANGARGEARESCASLKDNPDPQLFAALRGTLAFFLKGAFSLEASSGPPETATRTERENALLAQAIQVVFVFEAVFFLKKNGYEDRIDAGALARDIASLSEGKVSVTEDQARARLSDFPGPGIRKALFRDLAEIVPRKDMKSCRQILSLGEKSAEARGNVLCASFGAPSYS